MWIVVAANEARRGLRSTRVWSATILILTLSLLGGILGGKTARSAREEAVVLANAIREDRSLDGTHIVVPALPYAFLSENAEDSSNTLLRVEPYLIMRSEDRLSESSALPQDHRLSWPFVFGVLGSFMAVVLGHDAFNGERGALRLAISGGLSRRALFAGKFAGLGLIASLVVVPGMLAYIAAWSLSGGSFEPSTALPVCLAGAATLAHLAVWVAVAAGVSALMRRPAGSLFVLFLTWAAACVFVPQGSRIAAELLIPAPSPRLQAERLAVINRSMSTGIDMEAAQAAMLIIDGGSAPDEKQRLLNLLGEETERRQERNLKEARRASAQIRAESTRALARRGELRERLASMSPYGLLAGACSAAAGGGTAGDRARRRAAEGYMEAFTDYGERLLQERRNEGEASESRMTSGSYSISVRTVLELKLGSSELPDFPVWIPPTAASSRHLPWARAGGLCIWVIAAQGMGLVAAKAASLTC